MLTIMLPETDDYPVVELQLEHSLVSLSKWEAIHEKAFFGKEPHTEIETVSYVEQMMLTGKVPNDLKSRLNSSIMETINGYINSKQSATWFTEEQNKGKSNDIITSELIYYWLIQFQIPFSCETWHLNRLMTLVKVCGIRQTKPRRMSKQAQAAQYRELNAQRRQQMGTNG